MGLPEAKAGRLPTDALISRLTMVKEGAFLTMRQLSGTLFCSVCHAEMDVLPEE